MDHQGVEEDPVVVAVEVAATWTAGEEEDVVVHPEAARLLLVIVEAGTIMKLMEIPKTSFLLNGEAQVAEVVVVAEVVSKAVVEEEEEAVMSRATREPGMTTPTTRTTGTTMMATVVRVTMTGTINILPLVDGEEVVLAVEDAEEVEDSQNEDGNFRQPMVTYRQAAVHLQNLLPLERTMPLTILLRLYRRRSVDGVMATATLTPVVVDLDVVAEDVVAVVAVVDLMLLT
mmetsp:Transcript_20927/g.49691  ORF Transcript_20927/g.49691 Transcript_20927/m.49691 type:complete len:230 (-) Transcript_20927:2567-3256(-)